MSRAREEPSAAEPGRPRPGLRPWPRLRPRLLLAFALSVALALVVGGTELAGEALAQAEPRIKTEGCEVYATNRVDPIAGMEHLHHQFGNTSTTDDSTGESLFDNKETSCATQWFTSAAWFPVERSSAGEEEISGISTYYRAPGEAPVEEIPKGLQLLGEEVMYNCTSSGAGSFQEEPPYGCTGDWTTRVIFPACWNEDSLEETSMVSSDNGSCPDSHPYRIPEISFLIRHDNADGELTEPLEVSGGVNTWEPYTEMHADYFAALQPAFEPLVDRCLREGGSCEDSASAAERDAARSAVARTDGAQTDGTETEGGGASEAPVAAPTGDGGSASPGEDSADEATDDVEEPGFLGSFAIDTLKAMFGFIWDWTFGWFGERTGEGLVGSLLYLPDPSEVGALDGIYDSVTRMLSPVLLVALLVMSLLMTLKAHNRGISYAGFSFLPRLLGVAIVLGALPFLMGELSKLGTELTVALLPSGDDALTAGKELVKAILGQLVVGNVMNLILAVAGTYVLFVVAVVTFFKNIFYILLFVAAPFPLVASLVPGLTNFASAWAKAVLVCAAIPALWAAELWLGSKLLVDPRVVFGEATDSLGFITNGMFTSIIAIIIMWIMYKTPFKVLSWAFVSYDPHRGGWITSFGKWAAMAAGKQALGQIAAAASNARSSGADVQPGQGGPAGAGGGPRLTESLREHKIWEEDSAGNVFNERTQYERTREMRETLDPNTVNMRPPQDHGPTDGGGQPNGYPQPPRREPGQLPGGGPSSPTISRGADNRFTLHESDPQPFGPRDAKED